MAARLTDRDRMLRAWPEERVQTFVENTAKAEGWLLYHTHDSRRSQPGFPDCVLARGARLVFAELKKQSERPTAAQEEWLAALEGTNAEVYIWRPGDMLDGTIEAVLR